MLHSALPLFTAGMIKNFQKGIANHGKIG